MADLSGLIDSIAPLYNGYKQNRHVLSGTEALEIMWEIGESLKTYIEKCKIKPHALYRSIYGKSEGSTNIVQKSYIPREFQGRCYRIRNIFRNKKEIREQLPTLRSFTCFREAMPFFDNRKYRLNTEEKGQLLALLNSDRQPKEIIERLPKDRIGIRNPRTQKLHEVEREKSIFIDFYNFVYELIKLCDFEKCSDRTKQIDQEFLRLLARNTSALSDEGLKFFEFKIPDDMESPWKEFANIVKDFSTQRDAKQRRRFRRLIPPIRIARLADMLYALLSEENYQRFR